MLFSLIVLVSMSWSIHALQYSELESLGFENCPEQNKCENVRNAAFNQRVCACDSSCRLYKDCCIDAPRSRLQPQRRFTCLQYGKDTLRGVHAISSCPSSSTVGEDIRQQCENDSFRDPLLSAPVIDTLNNKVYLNRYCALCNDASDPHLKTWLIYACKVESASSAAHVKPEYREDLKQWGVQQTGGFTPCEFEFRTPEETIANLRQCWLGVVTKCPATYKRQKFIRGCASYTSVSMDVEDEKIYKNPHCAICNGVPSGNIECLNPMKPGKVKKPFSFAVIFDVNPATGPIVGAVQKCSTDNKYDPFFEKCRKLKCAIPGYVKSKDKCVPGDSRDEK